MTYSSDEPDDDEESQESSDYPVPESDTDSSDSSRESSPDNITVQAAIASATEERLRKTLIELCIMSSPAEELVRHLLISRSDKDSKKKRKIYEICTQCSEEYTVEDNNRKSCVFHLGQYITYKRGRVVHTLGTR